MEENQKSTGQYTLPLLILVALVLEVVLFGSYGAMASQKGLAKAVKPETVLTAQNVQTIVGKPFKMESSGDNPEQNFNQCVYSSGKTVVRVGVVQAVSKADPAMAEKTPAAIFNSLKTTMGETTAIKGLGKDNLVAGNELVLVLQSGRMLAVAYEGEGTPTDKAAMLKHLGEQAVHNLNRIAYPAE